MTFSTQSIFATLIAVCTTSALYAERMDVQIIEDTGAAITLQYDFPAYRMKEININGRTFVQPVLEGENHMMVTGYPALPDVSRGIIIPDQGDVSVRVLNMTSHDVEGVAIAPSKGTISRAVDPATIPFTFSDSYKQDAFWPAEIATAREPHIIRDLRGTIIDVSPFQYNPQTKTLRVIDSLTLSVTTEGTGGINAMARSKKHSIGSAYSILMDRHFLNYDRSTRYDPLSDDGELLIICYDDFQDEIQPFADHKNSIGIITTVVPVSSIGNSEPSIAAYIQNVYNSSDLGFVLLVGDAFQVATGSHPYEGGATQKLSLADSQQKPALMLRHKLTVR
jgi:hypothetical protein